MNQKSTEALALPITEAARLLGIGKTKLFDLVRTGALPAVRLGGRTLIRRADLEMFAAALPRWRSGGPA